MNETSKQTPRAFRERHARVLELLHTTPRMTLAEIGAEVGVSRERVRQINDNLGKYGRSTRAENKKNRELAERLRVEEIEKRVEESHGKLWPRRQLGVVKEPKTYPTRKQAPVEYQAYANAKQRCTNLKHPLFKGYGARGILFKFNDFKEFWEHIGPMPWVGLELDRIDNEGHYEAGNVRWTTHKVNCAPGRRRHKS